MPIYEFECSCGNEADIYLPVNDRDVPQYCCCGKALKRKIVAPSMSIKQYGDQMALDSLNKGISARAQNKSRVEAVVMSGINPPKKVIGRGSPLGK